MYQVSVYLHILAAMVWAGGMLFLALVVVPATRGLPPAQRGALIGAIGRRFRLVGWIALGVLIVTGVINAGYRGLTWEGVAAGQLGAGAFGRILTTKLSLVGLALVLAVVHDFVLGPASARALEQATPEALKTAELLRRRTSWLARIEALVALLIVFLAVGLVRGLPW